MNCVKCKVELPEGAIYCHMCGKKQTPTPRKALKRPNGTGTTYKLLGHRKRPWVAAKNKVVLVLDITRQRKKCWRRSANSLGNP